MPKRYVVYLNGQRRRKRLGILTAPDRHAAIEKATERYGISETLKYRLELILVRPPKLKRIKARVGPGSEAP